MPQTSQLFTQRLVLDPLMVDDAAEMVGVLADPRLYEYTGGEPPSAATLMSRYRNQVAGSGDDGEVWHNWIVRVEGIAVGFVQATVSPNAAVLAWVIGVPWQGKGIATEASRAVRDWLAGQGSNIATARIHPANDASKAVAANLGLSPSGVRDRDGEMIWR